MGGDNGVEETPAQKALAEHANNLMADYQKRWAPVQQRMIETTHLMGREGSAAREAAAGRHELHRRVVVAPFEIAGNSRRNRERLFDRSAIHRLVKGHHDRRFGALFFAAIGRAIDHDGRQVRRRGRARAR